jgi:hypothetical protein
MALLRQSATCQEFKNRSASTVPPAAMETARGIFGSRGNRHQQVEMEEEVARISSFAGEVQLRGKNRVAWRLNPGVERFISSLPSCICRSNSTSAREQGADRADLDRSR